MSIERARLNGLQDRRLEPGRVKSTPTKDSGISERARLYKSLATDAAMAHMALEGMSGGRGTQEMMDAQTAQIRATRREAVLAGFKLEGFDLVVKDKIATMKAQEEERLAQAGKDGNYALLRQEFPGVFPDEEVDGWEKQAFMGESPVHRDDAGGFETRRRGW